MSSGSRLSFVQAYVQCVLDLTVSLIHLNFVTAHVNVICFFFLGEIEVTQTITVPLSILVLTKWVLFFKWIMETGAIG